jgi:6-phosphogluconolactonase
VVADLGLDKVLVYRVDSVKAALTAHTPPAISLAPGAGPRHVSFHPSGRYLYVINEMNCTVAACKFDSAKGTLEPFQTISTLPEDFRPGFSTAEIEVHPSGKFVYGSNRGHDTIVVFAIDTGTGGLTLVQHQATGGKTPRNFGIDPLGRHLLAANQGSDTVVVFRIDPDSGKLSPTGQSLEVPTPVCVKFL